MEEQLYSDLAPWWALLQPVESYADEAESYLALIGRLLARPPLSLLELGSGVGHLAANLPDELDVHLVDLAPEMVAWSERANPGRTHHVADMRTLRLGRVFDAVLLHDAVMYLLSDEDLAAAFATAAAHLEPGGVLLVRPDVVAEDFEEGVLVGGREGDDGSAVQLMEWHWDPDPTDRTFRVDFSFLLRDPDGSVRAVHDPHTMGLHPTAAFLRGLQEAGFELVDLDLDLDLEESGTIFAARRR